MDVETRNPTSGLQGTRHYAQLRKYRNNSIATRDAEVKIQKAGPVRLRHHLLTRSRSARECPLAPPNSQARRNRALGGKGPEGGHQEAALFSGRGAPFLAAVIGCTKHACLAPTPSAHGSTVAEHLTMRMGDGGWGGAPPTPWGQLPAACPPTRSCSWSLSWQLLGCGPDADPLRI